MIRRIVALTLGLAAAGGPAAAHAAVPFQQDSLGPLTDVTAHWQRYQPARAFCIRPDAPQYTPGGTPGGALQRGPLRAVPDPVGGLVNHQMGTMRMGADPDTSVLNPGQRFWGIPNLYVIDGSVFPTSGGYNPTLTIEALAWRAAEGIVHAHRYRKRHRHATRQGAQAASAVPTLDSVQIT